MQISNSWIKSYSVRGSEDHLVFMGQSSLTAGVETVLVQLKSRYTKKTRARISTQYALSDLFKRTFTPFSSLDFCQVSVQSLSHIWLFATPWTAAHKASLSITNSQSLLRLMSIESVMPSNYIVPFFSCFQSFSESGSFQMSQFFASGGQSTGVPALASVLPMNTEDWFPLGLTGLLSLQSKGLLSLLQYHSSKASIFLYSAFFMVQLSHPYMTTGKLIALTRWTFVSKTMSLLFNMLSRLVITFLPRSNYLLISWLQSPYTVILEPKKIKLLTVSIVSHLFAMKWWDQMPGTWFLNAEF